MQNRVHVLVGKVLVLNDLCNFTFAVVVIHFVGKIAGEHKGLVANRFDEAMKRVFSAFATDEYIWNLFDQAPSEPLTGEIPFDNG